MSVKFTCTVPMVAGISGAPVPSTTARWNDGREVMRTLQTTGRLPISIPGNMLL